MSHGGAGGLGGDGQGGSRDSGGQNGGHRSRSPDPIPLFFLKKPESPDRGWSDQNFLRIPYKPGNASNYTTSQDLDDPNLGATGDSESAHRNRSVHSQGDEYLVDKEGERSHFHLPSCTIEERRKRVKGLMFELFDSFTTLLICKEPLSLFALEPVLDEVYYIDVAPTLEVFGEYAESPKVAIFGRLAEQNVLIVMTADQPDERIEHTSTTRSKYSKYQPFETVLYVSMVGGAPSPDHDIRLGDVVVAADGHFVENAVGCYTFRNREGQSIELDANRVAGRLNDLYLEDSSWGGQMFQKPDRATDLLFESDYHHVGITSSCQECDPTRLVKTQPRMDDALPVIHYGSIAQTAYVVKDGRTRAELRDQLDQLDVLSFELGLGPFLSGIRATTKVVAIQGISDYADSHKSKIWRNYAAAAAAATAKEYLGTLQYAPNLRLPNIPKDKRREMILDTMNAFLDSKLSREGELTLSTGDPNTHLFPHETPSRGHSESDESDISFGKQLDKGDVAGEHAPWGPGSPDHNEFEVDSNDSRHDMESILSMGSQLSTAPSTQPGTIEESASQWTTRWLLEDPELRGMYPEALERIGPERFRRNFARILKKLSEHLRSAASNQGQRQAALFVRRSRQRLASAVQQRFELSDSSRVMPPPTDLDESRAQQLNEWLKALVPEPQGQSVTALARGPEEQDAADSSDSESEVPREEYLSNLEELKEFVSSPEAIHYVRRIFRKWLDDGKLGDMDPHEGQLLTGNEDLNQVAEVPLPDSEASCEAMCQAFMQEGPLDAEYDVRPKNRVSILMNHFKKTSEHALGFSLSWWPLKQPEEEPRPGFTRVYSQFSVSQNPTVGGSTILTEKCGYETYNDVKTSQAELWFPKLSEVNSRSRSRPAVFLRKTTLLQCLIPKELDSTEPKDPKVNKTDNQPQSTRASTQTNPAGSVTAANQEETVSSENKRKGDLEDESQDRWTAPDRQDHPKPVIFLTTDIEPRKQKACARSVAKGSDDRATMTEFWSTYRSLRPGWLWEPTRIKFYRFETFSFDLRLCSHRIELDRTENRYPSEDDQDYHLYLFNPKPWPKKGLFPASEVLHFLEHPQDCATSHRLNHRLPVRLRDLPTSGADDVADHYREAFGIHVEQELPVRILVLTLLLVFLAVFGGTVWFIPFWLNKHPGDLQNATVPIVVASAVVMGITSICLAVLFFRHQVAR